MPGGVFSGAKLHAMTVRESADDGSDFTNPDADYRRLFLGEDGKLHVKDSAGAVTDPGGAAVGNAWTMANGGSSQTLTSNADNTVTFDTAEVDGGSSVIDLVNERFVAPATGLYLTIPRWIWESTAPINTWTCQVTVGGIKTGTALRCNAGTIPVNGSAQGTQVLSLTSGDFVTMLVNPGVVTGCTARGNASSNLRTSFSLVRIT